MTEMTKLLILCIFFSIGSCMDPNAPSNQDEDQEMLLRFLAQLPPDNPDNNSIAVEPTEGLQGVRGGKM